MRTIENVIYTSSSSLYAGTHLAMYGFEGRNIEIATTKTGLICYDDCQKTGIVQTPYGIRNIVEDLELIGVVAIWNILRKSIVAIQENRLMTEHLPLDYAADDVVRT